MGSSTLHYIHDPLCGWCYGAAPLLRAARGLLPIEAHGGGMLAGPQRQPVTPALRAFVLPHDARIHELSGQPFGDAYRDGLLRDAGAVFDSAPPTTAMLAARQLAGRELDLLARMQRAHYLEGRRIAEPAVLQALAADIGLDPAAFAAAQAALAGEATQAHIEASRRLLAQLGGRGFPTFALQRDGRWQAIDFGAWIGRPEAWRDWLGAQPGIAAG